MVIGIAVPRFAYRLSSSPGITPGVKVQKSLKGEWLGVGWPSWLDWKQTRLCIFTRQKYYRVRFAAEVLQWHLKGEFMFEPGSVSETKNHCYPVCVLSNMLQQQSEEGNHSPEWKNACLKSTENLIRCPIYAPFFTFQFTIFLYTIPSISKVFCLVFVFHNRMLRFFSFPLKKKKLHLFSAPFWN